MNFNTPTNFVYFEELPSGVQIKLQAKVGEGSDRTCATLMTGTSTIYHDDGLRVENPFFNNVPRYVVFEGYSIPVEYVNSGSMRARYRFIGSDVEFEENGPVNLMQRDFK